MTQAKQRNPNIKLYGLPWAFPAWVGNGTGNPYAFPQLTAEYIVKWVDGAKTVYGLDIDYVVWRSFLIHCTSLYPTFISLSIYLSIYLSIRLSIYLSIHF